MNGNYSFLLTFVSVCLYEEKNIRALLLNNLWHRIETSYSTSKLDLNLRKKLANSYTWGIALYIVQN